MKKGVLIASVLVLLLIPGALLAQGTCTQKTMNKVAAELSEEQLAKLEELHLELKMANIKLKADLEILQIKMHRELAKDKPSERELENLVSKTGAVREKLDMNRIEHMLGLRKILGPDHWKQFSQCCGGMGDCGMMMKGGGGSCCGMGKGSAGASCCGMGKGSAGASCCCMGGHCSMGMGHGGAGCCGMGKGSGGMGGGGMCCPGMSKGSIEMGHCCVGKGSAGAGHCWMGKHSSMAKKCAIMCCGHTMSGSCCLPGSRCMGGACKMSGSCCMGGACKMSGSCCMGDAHGEQKSGCPGGAGTMKGCTPEKKTEKIIKRHCIKKMPSKE